MKKILVTGSSGYIGSHLCKLLEDEYEVHGLDVQDPQIPVKHFHKQDIRYKMHGFDNAEPYDAIIHLAALVNVGESETNPVDYYTTNLFGTMNVIENIPTTNFIFASTGAAQGCVSSYGVSKRAAEDCVRQISSVKSIDATIFRFYNVIGSTVVPPTNPDGLFYNLIKAADTGTFTIHGNDYEESWDGTCVRDYVHVNEICQALKDAIETPSNSIESLGHGVGYTVREIVSLFQKVNDIDIDVKYGPRRPGDMPSSVLENVSPYMMHMYTMEELLKVDNK